MLQVSRDEVDAKDWEALGQPYMRIPVGTHFNAMVHAACSTKKASLTCSDCNNTELDNSMVPYLALPRCPYHHSSWHWAHTP